MKKINPVPVVFACAFFLNMMIRGAEIQTGDMIFFLVVMVALTLASVYLPAWKNRKKK